MKNGHVLSPCCPRQFLFSSRHLPSERRFLRFLFQHSLLRLLLFLFFRSHPSILLCSLQLRRRAYLGLRSWKSRLRCVCLCYFPIAAPRCWRFILAQRSGPPGRDRPPRRLALSGEARRTFSGRTAPSSLCLKAERERSRPRGVRGLRARKQV